MRKHANTLSLAIRNICDIRSVLLENKIDSRLPTELELMHASTTTFKHTPITDYTLWGIKNTPKCVSP